MYILFFHIATHFIIEKATVVKKKIFSCVQREMQILFFTRFSIYDPTTTSFRCVKKNNYYDFLFSKDRLDKKFTIFEKLTLPSIVNQTRTNWTWYIFTCHHLPVHYISRLEKMTEKYPTITIHFVQDMKDFQHLVQQIQRQYSHYASVRLDDDDGLSLEYVDILSTFQNEKSKFISFSKGQLVTLNEDNDIVYGKKIDFKNNAFGLAAINRKVFTKCNHIKINEFYDVIYPENENMYYAFCSHVCDTEREFQLIEKT